MINNQAWAEAAILAARIADDPAVASDSDKLRSTADWIDLQDRKAGRDGSEVQDWLRDLADRLEQGARPDGIKFTLTDVSGRPKELRLWRNDVLIFDGVDRSALAERRWPWRRA